MRPTNGRLTSLANLGLEFSQTVRALRGSPASAVAIVGVVALAMAVAVSAFRLVDGVLFKPLPYQRASELFQVSGGYSPEVVAAAGQRQGQSSGLGISHRDVMDLASAVPSARFTLIAGGASGGTLGDLRAWSPNVVRVDANFFDVLGVSPFVGGFVATDFEASSDLPQPAMVSYRVWQQRLNGRADALGQVLVSETASGTPVRFRVAGILPFDFLYPTGAQQPDILTALVLTELQRTERKERNFQAVARLDPHVATAEIQARFDAVGTAGREEISDRTLNGGLGYWDRWALRPLTQTIGSSQRATFWSVFVAAGVLLLLACLNVSGLIASRATDRAREIGLRRALGAQSRDIARLVLLECFTLIGIGCAIGVIASEWIVSIILGLLPSNLGLLKDTGIDWRVAIFVVLALTVATLAVAFWPIRRSVHPSLSAMGASSTPRGVGRSVAISGQVALALVLTLGGTLVVGSLVRIWQTDLGYPASDLLVVEGTLSTASPAGRMSTLKELLDRTRQLPAVAAAGATQGGLLRGGSPGGEFKADTYAVTSGFFDALGATLVEGRYPTAEELDSVKPVAVASKTFASAFFPNGSAVGRSITTPNGKNTFTVVGVIDDARYSSWTSTGLGGQQFYRPLVDSSRFTVAVRFKPGQRQNLGDLLRVASEVPSLRLTRAALAEDLLQDTIKPQRFRSWLFGSFSVAALVIAGVGILGLVTAVVTKRTREVGIRMALGSTSTGVVRLLLREHVTPVAIGLVAGTVISYWAVDFVKSYLYEIAPYDAGMWALAMLVILAVAMFGVLIPAARLGRTNPVRALRAD